MLFSFIIVLITPTRYMTAITVYYNLHVCQPMLGAYWVSPDLVLNTNLHWHIIINYKQCRVYVSSLISGLSKCVQAGSICFEASLSCPVHDTYMYATNGM